MDTNRQSDFDPQPEVGEPLRRILAADRVGWGRETAAINRPQSRRFALAGPHRTSRQRLDCACFSTALCRTVTRSHFRTAAISISEPGFKSSPVRRHTSGDGRRAFTLTELLVVLATLAILAVVLLPAVASTQPAGAKAFQCLNNLRQMGVAWTLYAGDNHDRLVNNFDVSSTQTEVANKTYRNWVNDIMDWSISSYVTNLDSIRLAPFYSYTGSIGVYKCPADNYLAPIQRVVGWTARPRSYSMNCFFGATTPTWAKDSNFFYSNYRQFLKTSAMPNPSNLYVLLEEHPDSINDGYFDNNANTNIAAWSPQHWGDLPGSNHAGCAGFSFGDGHSEIHQWKSYKCTILPVKFSPFSLALFGSDTTGAAIQDAQWLASHSSVPR